MNAQLPRPSEARQVSMVEIFGRAFYGDAYRPPSDDPLPMTVWERLAVLVAHVLALAAVYAIGLGCYALWRVVVG